MFVSLAEYWIGLKTWEIILLGFFVLLFVFRVVIDFVFYGKVAFYKMKLMGTPDQFNGLSIIMTVRNEEENIKENLQALLSYMTGRGEVIVVDDFSQDQTFILLGLLREQYPNLKISSLNQEIRYSVKVSQNIGMKAASEEWVIFIPPHISGLPENWLSQFQNCFFVEKNTILGYSNVKYSKGFFNHLFRIESFFQQLKSFSFLLNGLGFVVNEENIAFRKAKYFEQGGYGKKIKETYANLELLINDFIKKKTTCLLLEPDSIIRTPISKTKVDFWDLLYKFRRIRSFLPFYKRFALASDELFRFFWIAVAAGIFMWFDELRIYIAAVFVLKIIIRGIVLKLSQNRVGEKKIFITSLLYDGLMPYLWLFASDRSYRGSSKRRWKK
jgi:glycosyltransferase involved in cell wall biosynthesis